MASPEPMATFNGGPPGDLPERPAIDLSGHLEDWQVADDDPDVAPVVVPDDAAARRARASGEALRAWRRRTAAWTCTYRADDDGTLARDPAFHAWRLAALMGDDAPAADPPPGAGRLGEFVATIRAARGLSRVDLAATVDGAGLDPAALALLEHGRLSGEEVGPVLLGRVAMAMGTPLRVLEALRDGAPGLATPAVAEREPVAVRSIDWVRRALGAILPASPGLAVALGTPGVDDEERRIDLAIDSHAIDGPVPLPVFTDVRDGAGADFTVVPVIVPEAHPLPGACGVEAHVRDAIGRPAAGRRLRLQVLNIPGLEDEEPTATTGDDGVARFDRVPLARLVESIGGEGVPVAILDD